MAARMFKRWSHVALLYLHVITEVEHFFFNFYPDSGDWQEDCNAPSNSQSSSSCATTVSSAEQGLALHNAMEPEGIRLPCNGSPSEQRQHCLNTLSSAKVEVSCEWLTGPERRPSAGFLVLGCGVMTCRWTWKNMNPSEKATVQAGHVFLLFVRCSLLPYLFQIWLRYHFMSPPAHQEIDFINSTGIASYYRLQSQFFTLIVLIQNVHHN